MHLKATYVLNIFIAYHPSDQAQFEELLQHLVELDKKNKGYIINKIWYDGLDLSEEARAVTKELLAASDLVLLLMSEDSILSPYFNSKELRETLKQHQNESSIVVPIILNTCWWEDTAFRHLEVLPRAGLPIYDNNNVKNELFDQVVYELGRRLEKIRLRKAEIEESFKVKIAEAELIFDNWQKRPEKLRMALPMYQEALLFWREGFVPDKKIIEARISICQREIDFKHYSKAATDALKSEDYQTCYFNCKDALDLRDDAVIRKMFDAAKKQLEVLDLKEKRAPFDRHLNKAHEYFLSLQWQKAEEQYTLALEHHQEKFTPSRKVIEHKIDICKREFILESSLQEANRLYKVQDYKKMADVLLDAVKSINHEALYQVDHAIKLIGYLQAVAPYRDEKNNKWGFINLEDETIIIAPKYTAAYNFSENLAGVKKWDKWGFIDIEGNEIIPFVYDYVSHFQNGIAQVIVNQKTSFINHKGEAVEGEVIELKIEN